VRAGVTVSSGVMTAAGMQGMQGMHGSTTWRAAGGTGAEAGARDAAGSAHHVNNPVVGWAVVMSVALVRLQRAK
jgi:hypothetical protein